MHSLFTSFGALTQLWGGTTQEAEGVSGKVSLHVANEVNSLAKFGILCANTSILFLSLVLGKQTLARRTKRLGMN
jgi:hypothetical protein